MNTFAKCLAIMCVLLSSSLVHAGLIDNVSVTVVPESDTLALIGIGLVGLSIARRRRV